MSSNLCARCGTNSVAAFKTSMVGTIYLCSTCLEFSTQFLPNFDIAEWTYIGGISVGNSNTCERCAHWTPGNRMCPFEMGEHNYDRICSVPDKFKALKNCGSSCDGCTCDD